MTCPECGASEIGDRPCECEECGQFYPEVRMNKWA